MDFEFAREIFELEIGPHAACGFREALDAAGVDGRTMRAQRENAEAEAPPARRQCNTASSAPSG